MKREWQLFEDECPECGSFDTHALTTTRKDNYAYDGDIVECSECGNRGSVVADGDDAYVAWDD